MRALRTTKQFERDLKLASKRGKDLDKIWPVIDTLRKGEPLEARHRPHPLVGDWKPCWECHIESDWLLIWQEVEDALELIRTGTHSDLFG